MLKFILMDGGVIDMLRAFVVDDEPIAADFIKRRLELTGKVKVESTFTNPADVIKEVERVNPDVVFLDIEMPEISGLELAEKITAMVNQPEVVFTTAYSNYALEAFKVNALDYLMKPIDSRELERVIQKIINKRPMVATNNTLHINALGCFMATVNEQKEPIKWSTAKCEELLAYMIFKKESTMVSKWKLIDVLWPDKDEKKCEINLRSTISRLNKSLREYGVNGRIVSYNNSYRIEISEIEVDAFQLEKLTDEWLSDGIKKLPSLKELYKLYPGHLFEDKDYPWADWLQSYYLRLFESLCKAVIHARITRNEDVSVTYYMLEYIIGLDPYNEDLREMALEILYNTGGKKTIGEYYNKFKQLLESQMGVSPRQSLKDLYSKLIALEKK